MKNSKSVYILSVEATDIYNHMVRGKRIKEEYVGMIPYSLELIKLRQEGINTKDSKRYNKEMSRDIINLKFSEKVNDGENIIKSIYEKIEKEEITKEREKNLLDFVKVIRKEMKDSKLMYKWEEDLSVKELREKLYTEGFYIDFGNEIINYHIYKRTSSKSRNGEVLAIRVELYEKMKLWSRMNIKDSTYDKKQLDFPSLLSYESLVSSAIEDVIRINPNNILIVNDVKSVFTIDSNVIEKNSEEILESNPVDNYIMSNDLFDGSGLLESSYFPTEKTMMLLRHHMFKSCVFSANIQQFLRDYASKNGIDFNSWEIKNMFGQPMLAKNVHMIITPNSLKALKFSHTKPSKVKMWEHWKNIVNKDDNLFGICKYDKKSKRGYDEEGNILNQTSYQILNSIGFTASDILELSEYERSYIEQLKNNNSVYIEYLKEHANTVNGNEMLVDLYNRNNKIASTPIFKKKRAKDIHNYISYCKKGKIRLNGDYCTLIGNVKEYLYHAIGKLPINSKNELIYEEWKNQMELKDNEIYATLHEFDNEYTAFRSPHTAPSNALLVRNRYSDFIGKYLNVSDNIVCVNAVNFPLQRILSGCDYDSDTIVIFNNNKLTEVVREKCFNVYNVCENGVGKDTKVYDLSMKSMSEIDNTLAKSTRQIGVIVNTGQHYMSEYYHRINNNIDEGLEELINKVNIATVLSEISIDQAKKKYNIEMKDQINYLKKSELLNKEKPLFFKYVSQNKNIDNKIKKYETSMDYLYEIMNSIKDAKDISTIELHTLLKDIDVRKVKKNKVEKIVTIIEEMTKQINSIKADIDSHDYSENAKKEKYNKIDDIENDYMSRIRRYKLNKETFNAIVFRVFSNQKRYSIEYKYKLDLLKTLHKNSRDLFLNAFKGSKK